MYHTTKNAASEKNTYKINDERDGMPDVMFS